MTTAKPRLPVPQPLTLDAKRTGVLVLDLTELCANPKEVCSRLVPGMTAFLEKARKAGVFIAYTVMASLKGTPMGREYSGFRRQPAEPVFYPDGFNKFIGGDLEPALRSRGIDTVIVTGFRSNIAVLYTATHAARPLKFRVVVPVDGMAAMGDYEQDYTLYQFTVLPGGASDLFTFTTLDGITFGQAVKQ
ncbi:MAG: cysteine hydrolase [Chloroflexi bacterium]|nr:cysteine hydrolase [Chloroflexota bacterium]